MQNFGINISGQRKVNLLQLLARLHYYLILEN